MIQLEFLVNGNTLQLGLKFDDSKIANDRKSERSGRSNATVSIVGNK